jgi:FMN reductase
MESNDFRPLIVGIGGTTRIGSTSEKTLDQVGRIVEQLGGRWMKFSGPSLILPMYKSDTAERTGAARQIIDAVRACDGLVLASPGYHGSFSGMVKNVLDYLEDLADDPRPFLEGRAVGCIASALGWQAIGTTLVALRSVVHALRGWPTPLGVSIHSAGRLFDETGQCTVPEVEQQLRTLAAQVMEFAALKREARTAA